PLSNSCGFFVEKKKRFCKMIAANGKIYCGEHATMVGSQRIVCPLDPKHTVDADKLNKHLKKCNSRQKPRAVYYVENINSGSADMDEVDQQVSLSHLSGSQVDTLLERLNSACTGLQGDLEDQLLSHPVLQDELNNPKNGDSAHKHLKQQASLLGHLEALGLLRRGRCFVEFGAGRGKLSHWIHEALRSPEGLQGQEELQLLLVDGKHQDSGVTFQRLHVDIEHLDLSKVPALRRCELPLVGVGKHLCGAATGEFLDPLGEPSLIVFPNKTTKGCALCWGRGRWAGCRSGSTLFAGNDRTQRRDGADPQERGQRGAGTRSWSWSGPGPGGGAVLPPSLPVAPLRWSAVLH
ncbi:unnamed protein product, partial [Tetraodon nigroviridis]